MVQQVIDVGAAASDGTGDPLRDAFTKINENFDELYGTVDNEGLTYGNIASNVAGITFNVTRYTESYAATPVLQGTGQFVGNVYVIQGNVLGGTTPLNDLLLTVTSLANVTVGNVAAVSAVGVPVAPVLRVNGLTGNVNLTVNNITGAASKAYVNAAIAANIANISGSVTDSLRANITAANAVISNHAARISTLESNSASQATQINDVVSVKANVSYVDTSISNALSSNAILANVQAVNANVAAANAAILLRANLSGANFSGNISANYISASNVIRTDSYFVGGSEINQGLGEAWANPAALFFGNSAGYYQVNLQNLDPTATGDFVVTADDGNDATNYAAFGVNGSQWNDPTYPAGKAHDGFVFVTGGNLIVQSETNDIQFYSGNIGIPQVSITAGNVIQLQHNTVIRFSDGTIQNTAFGGNANLTSLNANITAANAAITSLQSNAAAQALDLNSLTANSASQGATLQTLLANAGTQSVAITNLDANVGSYQIFSNANSTSQAVSINLVNANLTAANAIISTLLSNSASQAQELDNLTSNSQAQESTIVGLVANSALQAVSINSINANVTAANINITSLSSNAGFQATQINLLNANLTAANSAISVLQSNAAFQQSSIDNLYANVTFYLANVASSNANIAAANARIVVLDANLGSTHSNVTTLQTNANISAAQISQLNADILAANIVIASKAALTNGNIQANYVIANANVKIASTLEVGNSSPINYPGLGAIFVGNVDSQYQIVVQNINTGPNATSSLKFVTDNGSNTVKNLEIGVLSSNATGYFEYPAGNTGIAKIANSSVISSSGNELFILTDANITLGANTSTIRLAQDGLLELNNCNLVFRDGSIQSTAVQDVFGLLANVSSVQVQANTISANLGAFQTYANLTLSTVANAASQEAEIDSISANVGAYQIFANANAASQAASIDTINSNIGAYQTFANANAASQTTSINTINANIGAYQTFANSTFTSYTNANVVQYLEAGVGGNIIPSSNVTYSLGNVNYQWKDLWVSNNTIYIGNTPIQVNNNTLLVNNQPVSGTYTNSNVDSYLQTTGTVRFGFNAGGTNQGLDAVALGPNAGSTDQGAYAISIGWQSGSFNQGENSVAVGKFAGLSFQSANSIAVGYYTGSSSQGNLSVAIGDYSGATYQGNNSISIGTFSGYEFQGNNAIAIGANAGVLNQHANSIVINASVTDLNSTAEGLFISPIREVTGGNVLVFDPNTKEITWANVGNVSYTPNNMANYDQTITNIQQALDELAARLRALGG